jgi:predicted O-methyltransferase YrrM
MLQSHQPSKHTALSSPLRDNKRAGEVKSPPPGKTAVHALLCLVGLARPVTQTSKEEQEILSKFATGKNRAVEIGVFEGVNTRLIAECLDPNGVIYAIDPFIHGRLGICWGQVVAEHYIKKGHVTRKVVFVPMMSYEAVNVIGGEFDFIFVDGDHSWEGIRTDWGDWAGRIGMGGIIALHDTAVKDPGQGKGVSESCRYFESTIKLDPRFEREVTVGSLNVLRRVK